MAFTLSLPGAMSRRNGRKAIRDNPLLDEEERDDLLQRFDRARPRPPPVTPAVPATPVTAARRCSPWRLLFCCCPGSGCCCRIVGYFTGTLGFCCELVGLVIVLLILTGFLYGSALVYKHRYA
jgi:hypothetical protein